MTNNKSKIVTVSGSFVQDLRKAMADRRKRESQLASAKWNAISEWWSLQIS